MKKLTKKEEIIMDLFWEKGPMFLNDLREFYDEPKPHFNTLSTQVRTLEAEGLIGHKTYGN
ncbi:MAG: BlaI/MecI/CopY family transcriptional regulator, partial [Bacteroidales bacterium]